MHVDVHNGAHRPGEVDEDGDQVEEEASDQPSSPHAITCLDIQYNITYMRYIYMSRLVS